MAKIRKNIFMEGLSGSFGEQLVIKHDKAGRTILSVKPTVNEKHEYSEQQKAHREAFQQATAYAQEAQNEEIYQEKAAGTPQSAYNVAVADWFHEPEVREVDLSDWHGQPGATIRVRAVDDVQVTQVTVLITTEDGVLLEQGAAVRADKLWWTYVTTATASGNPRVVVTARDLAGHLGKLEKTP
jgi:hypothetical protein